MVRQTRTKRPLGNQSVTFFQVLPRPAISQPGRYLLIVGVGGPCNANLRPFCAMSLSMRRFLVSKRFEITFSNLNNQVRNNLFLRKTTNWVGLDFTNLLHEKQSVGRNIVQKKNKQTCLYI